MRRWLVGLAVVATGCASGGSVVESPQPEASAPDTPPAKVLDRGPLERAEREMDGGDERLAAMLADSLWGAWLGVEELDPGSARDLADLLVSLGAEDRAAHLWLRVPFELSGGDRSDLREISEQLSIREMEELLGDGAARPDAGSILRAELAWALAVAGRPERARQAAELVLAGSPDGVEEDKAEDVLEGRPQPAGAPVRVGVVLPATGRFAAVGDRILEGALLALEGHRSDPENAPVELVVVDDSSRVDVGIEQFEYLEEQGVAAVLGPLRSEALASAAIRREERDLLILSPTASSGPEGEANAYTLWDRDRRETDVATALITWMIEEMRLETFGVLFPQGWSAVALDGLNVRAEELGGRIVSAQSYATDSTTFGEPITALADAEPEAVLVFADRPRTVLQLAPQLVYYGLRRWVTGGDANWSDPAVTRQLDPSYADHRLVSTYVDRLRSDGPWDEFKVRYEAEYRKALDASMFAALGYDAMNLILLGLPEAETGRRGAVGRAIRRGTHAGATGEIGVEGQTGGLRRSVFVRVIRDGQLHVPDPEEMSAWAAEQLELEEFLKALEEEKEKEEEEGS